jgi:hypothetical protein
MSYNFQDMFTITDTRRIDASKPTTANGAKTLATTKNKVLDLFAVIASSRKNESIVDMFLEAWNENQNLAVRCLLWARDVRGGAGERAVFRRILNTIAIQNTELAKRIAVKIPEIGRFDDLLILEGTAAENTAFEIIRQALLAGNGLCAKWMPRQDKKGAKGIRNYMGMTPKEWRSMLVNLSAGVVEQKMSAGNWSEINFEHVPSVAASRLQKAFARNAPEEYSAYRAKLVSGEAKINAAAIFPHDVLRHVGGDIAEAQWKALPNFLEGSTCSILPVVDVSGSMESNYINDTTSVKDVAVALGIYLAERNESVFKDLIISFSGRPNFHTIDGKTLQDKVNQVNRSGEDMSTNLQGVFEVLLATAKRNGWKDSDMPGKLVIFSDMEFNRVGGAYNAKSNFKAIKQQYKDAGLTRPHLVFWNLAGRPNNNPVKMSEEDTTLVSGFSPAILKTIVTDKTVTPMDAMLEVLLADRYNF